MQFLLDLTSRHDCALAAVTPTKGARYLANSIIDPGSLCGVASKFTQYMNYQAETSRH